MPCHVDTLAYKFYCRTSDTALAVRGLECKLPLHGIRRIFIAGVRAVYVKISLRVVDS